MKGSIKRLILISFIISLMSTIGIYYYISSPKDKEKVKKIKILVSAENISRGTPIEDKMIKEVEVEYSDAFSNYVRDKKSLIGRFAKVTIYKNEPFIWDKLIDKDSSSLSFKLPKNHRAVSVSVTGDTGVSYLLKPGDRVDVLVFLKEKMDNDKTRPSIAKTIIQDVEVLAIDRNTQDETKTKDDGKVPQSFFVTLSIPNDDVEKLVLAEGVGIIELALRPINSEDRINSKGAVEDNLLNSTSSITYKTIIYTVKKGDTLRNISRKFYGTPDNYIFLKQINGIKNENLIEPGMKIKVLLPVKE